MKRSITFSLVGAALTLSAWITFASNAGFAAAPPGGDTLPTISAPASAGARSITLPTIQSDLPPGPGREAAAAGCILCHSNRYITGQPPFPRTQWTATVDKMRKTYGAPMTDDQAKQIVDYLVAVRGTEGQPSP